MGLEALDGSRCLLGRFDALQGPYMALARLFDRDRQAGPSKTPWGRNGRYADFMKYQQPRLSNNAIPSWTGKPTTRTKRSELGNWTFNSTGSYSSWKNCNNWQSYGTNWRQQQRQLLESSWWDWKSLTNCRQSPARVQFDGLAHARGHC